MRFVWRLVAGTLLVSAVAIATLVATAEIALRRDLEVEIRGTLEREARLVARALPADSLAWQGTVERLAAGAGLRFTVIDSAGRVRAESEEPREALPRIENHADRPEVRQALTTGVGSDRRMSRTVGRPLMYVAVRAGPGVVRVAASLAQADQIVRRAQRSILGAAGVALVLGAAMALIAGLSIARPLTSITGAAREIALGATPSFPRSGIPDIDGLVRALREMHTQLDQRFTALRQARAESEALVEAMAEGVLAADARGRVVTANAAARRLLGYAESAPLPDLPSLFRPKSARQAVDEVLAGRTVEGRELELDGRTVLLTGRPLGPAGTLLVLHDVSAFRRLDAVRRDFVANVSHELKTPLTSIAGYAETLVAGDTDPATTHRFLEVILQNARRMQRLVDDLLDLARIESGRWQPASDQVETTRAAREAWTHFADRAASREVTFDIIIGAGADTVTADPEALRQVLTNLFDNALRHTPAGGRITLAARAESGGVTVSVGDTGMGIPPEHLPRIFERFYRVDPARSRQEGGTGLGLAIVRHLVEAHQGRITARSEPGQGTEVACWFPNGTEGAT